MRSSDNISDLATALSKAQSQMTAVAFDSQNPHYRNRYASLTAFERAVRGPLTSNGICWVQGTMDGQMVTRLMHSSGQWIETYTPMLVSKQDMQGVGSAITYSKRYGLSAALGISADEDDDAQAAVQPSAPAPGPQPISRVEGRQIPTAAPAARAPVSAETYIVPQGKYRGKSLQDIGRPQVEGYMKWINGLDKPSGWQMEFADLAEAWLLNNDDQPPLPEFDPSEEIPF